jgi:hypothetical protein
MRLDCLSPVPRRIVNLPASGIEIRHALGCGHLHRHLHLCDETFGRGRAFLLAGDRRYGGRNAMRAWLAVGCGVLAVTAVVAARLGPPLAARQTITSSAGDTATPGGIAVSSSCPALADLPYYGGAQLTQSPNVPALPPTPSPDRYIPPRPPMHDPCTVRLLPVPQPGAPTSIETP